MRYAYFVAMAFLVLVESGAGAATLRSMTTPESPRIAFDSVPNKESTSRHLRVDDDLSLFKNEERDKSSELVSKFKTQGNTMKKLGVTAEKMKVQKLAAARRKFKADALKMKEKLNSMELDNFARLFKGKFTPERAMSTGKLKNSKQLDKYKDFFELAKLSNSLKVGA